MSLFPLRLAAPLFYQRDDSLEPFSYTPAAGELIFAWTIPAAEALSIEPAPDRFLECFLLAGRAAPGPADPAISGAGDKALFELPRGMYFFSQIREILDREASLGLAIEVQKEALWQRFLPEPRFYLRRLFEDGRGVTQIFRPLRPAHD
ncbi:MAG: hypothetical protein LBO80_09850 [Treponema sp.]|jgi:hypothetical protein|nr:hypothetical protein [Treponema sp.]